MIEKNDLLLEVCNIAIKAGEEILKYYTEDIHVTHKDDSSPLTKADLASNKIIINALQQLDRTIPILSEESLVEWKERKNWTKYWLVDPLDGTKEFIKRNGEFTVNIALIRKGDPVLGVVYQPAKDILYFAEQGSGSFKKGPASEPVKIVNDVHYMDLNEVKVVASRSHLTEEVNEFVQGLERIGKKVNMVSVGSSLKLCLVAEGAANVYPRFGPTMEWDTGAAQAVVMESGRKVLNRENNDMLRYNKVSLMNPWFIVE